MLRQSARTFRDSVLFGLGTSSTSLASFLLVPLYTRVLSPADYGTLELILVTVALSTRVLSLEMHAAVFRRYFAHSDGIGRSAVVGTAVTILVPFAALSSLLLAISAREIARLLFRSSGYVSELQVAFGIAFFDAVITLPFALLRAQERSLLYSCFSVVQCLLTAGFILLFVLLGGWGLLGILLGQLVGVGLIWLLVFFPLAGSLRPCFSRHEARRILRFALPLLLANLGTFVLNSSDRYFLNVFASTTEVGIYSLGYKIAAIITVLLVTPFRLAWPAVMFSVEREAYAPQFYARMLTYVAAIGSFTVLGVTLIAPYLVRVMATPAYERSVQFVPIISSAYLAYLCYPVLAVGVNLKERTEHHTFAMLGAGAVNLALNYLLIPPLGMAGAAIATAACYLLMALWIYFPASRLYPIPFEWARVAKAVLSAYVLLAAALAFAFPDTRVDLLYRAALLVAYPTLLSYLRFFDSREIKQARLAGATGLRRLRTLLQGSG